MKLIRSLTFILAVLLICRVCAPVALAEDDSSLPDISGDSISVLMPDTDNEADSETDELVPDTGADGGSDDGDLLILYTGADSDSGDDGLLPPDTNTDSGSDSESDSDEDSLLITDTDANSGSDDDGLLIPPVPAAVVLTHFDEPDRTDAVAFALGTSQDVLTDWFADYYGGFTGYDAQGNYYYLMTGTWSLENVDTGTPDVYYASAAPDLGDDYILGDGVSLPRQLCAVSIQTPGEPDINCCVSARGFLRFPWVLSTEQQEQLEQFTVWIQQDGGAWTQLSEGFYFTSDDLQLSQRIFEYGSTYDLRVSYPGGQTGVLTFQYDGELLIVDYAGGDRDGGDVDGSGPLAGSQPAPPPAPTSSHSDNNHDEPTGDTPSSVSDITLLESSPASNEAPVTLNPEADEPQSEPMIAPPATLTELIPALNLAAFALQTKVAAAASRAETHGAVQNQDSAETANHVQKYEPAQTIEGPITQKNASTVQESYSPTQTTISGLRLRDLCAGEKSVVFGEGSLTVSILSKLLLALELADTDTLSVKLTQPENNQVTLAVDTYGSPVTELPGTRLRLRYTPQSENSEIAIWNEAGEKTADAEFDGEFLYFTVDTAGTYTIAESTTVTKEAQAAQGGASPLLPLMGGGLLLAAGGGTVLFRRYHG